MSSYRATRRSASSSTPSDPAARREGAERVATPLGVPVEDIGEGYYDARRCFGPIAYSVIAIPPEERQ
ncbi:hypothetical protein [Streptomyces albicerus]|uniref:hypothetical protein n=1 Tax=Streptomyces albicerus TaxID=2569859 RepID=UPI001CED54DA|nr:hypothetical protein [Streptomyces albicerus]